MIRFAFAALAVFVATEAVAQEGLALHTAVVPEAPGETQGMRQADVDNAPGTTAWIGPVVLALPPASVQTVGLEIDPDGLGSLSLWLTDDASSELAAVTEAAVGGALAVVYGRRVLAAPVVASSVTNGLVQITGLDARDARALAGAIRAATGADAGARPNRPPPVRTPPEPSAPERPALDTAPAPRSSPRPEETADDEALAFARAIAAKNWLAAADLLHPQAHQAVRPDAVAILSLRGDRVQVTDGPRQESIDAAEVLGRPLRSQRIDDIADRDLAALHFAALDALGVWGPPRSEREVVGRVRDGDVVHVVLRSRVGAAGLSDVSTITLRPDASGRWRPLVTEARGY